MTRADVTAWFAGLNLRSPLGRRLLAMLALATLAPIAILALLADYKVSRTLRDSRSAELAQHAKNYGFSVLDRLLHLEHDLDVRCRSRPARAAQCDAAGRTWPAACRGSARIRAGRCHRRRGRAGRQRARAGRRLVTAQCRAARATGRRTRRLAAAGTASASRRCCSSRASRRTRAKQFIVAAVAADYLWSTAELNPLMTHFCVALEGRLPQCQPTAGGSHPVATPPAATPRATPGPSTARCSRSPNGRCSSKAGWPVPI
jgi:hypothetical protein